MDIKNLGKIYFCGIGGIGMSGIAEILHNLNYKVEGSDLSNNNNVARLRKLGIKVFLDQKEKNIKNIQVVVRSSAIKDTNLEIIAARKNNIPVILRADMLKEIMHLKKSITVAGTHGKTTTTSMIAHLLEEASYDPTVINGGILNYCNTNAYLGKGDWLVAEADESDGSFNKLPATVAVVTNIDPEHMEYYGNFTNLRNAFKTFVENIPFYGFAVMCNDHLVVKNLIKEITDRKIISYGFDEGSNIVAHNVRIWGRGYIFDVKINLDNKIEKTIQDIKLPIFGKHNISNSLAMITIACEFGIEKKIIKKAIENFMGVKRRLTVRGKVNKITIIDDYAHHPTEIKASLQAVQDMKKNAKKGNIIAVVQPHRYSRVYDLFNDFATSFELADKVFICDIFAAGEKKIAGIDNKSMIKAIKEKGKKDAFVIKDLENLATELKEHLTENDIIICMGAGDITKYANSLPKKLKKVL